MKIGLLIILYLTFNLSATSFAVVEQSDFEQSLYLYQSGQYQQSAVLLKALILKDPQKSIYWFNYANAQFMLKNYERALKAFDRVIVLNSTYVAPAKLYRIKTFRQLGLHEKAMQEATTLSSDMESGLPSSFKSEQKKLQAISDLEEQALSDYQDKKYDLSENLLNSVAADGLSTEGRLLLALTLLKQKKFFESEKQLSFLTQSTHTTIEQKNTISDLLRKLRQGDAESSPYILGTDISTGYLTNVYGDGKSIIPTASSFTRATLGLGYHFQQGEKFSQKLSLGLNYENPQKAPELLAVTQNAQILFSYQPNHFEVSLSPYFQSQSVNNTSSTRKLGTTLKSGYSSDFYEAGFDFDVYDVKSLTSGYDYLTGTSMQSRPYIGFWSNEFYTQLSWLQGQDGSQDLTFTDGSKLPLTQVYQGPSLRSLWRLSDVSTVSFGISYIQHDFKNLSSPQSKKRKDQELTAYFKKSYTFFQRFSLYGLFEGTANSSTFGSADVRDKNYDSYSFSIGFTVDAF